MEEEVETPEVATSPASIASITILVMQDGSLRVEAQSCAPWMLKGVIAQVVHDVVVKGT